MIVNGRQVQHREKNNGKEEKIMVEGNTQCNGKGERAMEKEKKLEGIMPKGRERWQRGAIDDTWIEKEPWPKEKERAMARKREKEGRGERSMAHGERE